MRNVGSCMTCVVIPMLYIDDRSMASVSATLGAMPHVAAFLVVAGLIVITPGPDMALVASNALNRGRRAALLTAAGVCTGLLVWTAASAAGIAAVLTASATAFTVVKLAGAV